MSRIVYGRDMDDNLDRFRQGDQAPEGRLIVGAGAAMFISAVAMLAAYFAGTV